jgi:uncharacterized phage-associated protein
MDARFDKPPYDPRRLANLILDFADREGVRVSNLALQKLLYFAHAGYLIKHKRPLVSGVFEAWQLGPVQPVVYTLFKAHGKAPITSRAKRMNFKSGTEESLPEIGDPAVRKYARRFVEEFAHFSSGQLVRMTHAKNGPWDHIVNESKKGAMLGLRISDALISERFRFHKVSVEFLNTEHEGDEDAPLG